MPKKILSEPEKTVWEFDANEFGKILRDATGIVDGNLTAVLWDGVTLQIHHRHPVRVVKELDGPNPKNTKEHHLDRGGKY